MREHAQVATSLRGAGVVPEAYAQKWFVGLCVHCLPYRHLATYVERSRPFQNIREDSRTFDPGFTKEP